MKPIPWLFIVILASTSPAFATSGFFQLSSFGGANPNSSDIQLGVQQLFQNTDSCTILNPSPCTSSAAQTKLVQQSLQLRQQMVDLVESQRRLSAQIPFVLTKSD